MPSIPDASSFTSLRKHTAQSLAPTKNLTQASVAPAGLVLSGTIGAVVKASTSGASANPSIAVTATPKVTSQGKKRG